MNTMIYDRDNTTYLINRARVARKVDDLPDAAALDARAMTDDWDVDRSSPFITWIAGDFVEGDKPNANKQFWTAGDLELAEYTIKYSPLNMVHKFRTPVGFFKDTRSIQLDRKLALAGADNAAATEHGSMKIQALSGLWSHIFAFESALVESADANGALFYSMECRGSKLVCAGDQGCGETFDYMRPDTHCDHLLERSSVRHIVDPVFRGGALIVPPTKPGWKEARAGVVSDAVLQEAAKFAEQNEAAHSALEADGVTMTAAGWEQLMSMVIASTVSP